jgi:uncharacterized protein (DUF58 family)
MSIRLTSDGLALILAQCCVFLAALSSGANLVYVVGSMVMALFIVSLVFAIRGFSGLDVHLRLPQEAQEGVAFPYRMVLANQSRRRLHMLRLVPRFRTRPEGAAAPEAALQARSVPVFEIDGGRSIELEGWLKLAMRGSYTTGGVAVQSVYPAGLLAREELVAANEEVVVLPAPLKHPFPVFPGFNQRALWAETGSNVRGEGSAFYGLREYVPGDPIRKIHWKATARQGRPMLTEDEEDRVNRYYVFIDLREAKRIGEGRAANLEVSIRVGATLTLQLLKLNCPVRVHLLDARLSASPQSFGPRDIPQAMRFLGRLDYTREGDFPGTILKLLRDVPPGSYLLFVLPDVDPVIVQLVQRLRLSSYPLLVLFNLPGMDDVRRAREHPDVRALVRAGIHTLFFDGREERVVAL